MKKQKKFLDNIRSMKQRRVVGFCCDEKNKTVLFSRGKKTTSFFTEDSKLYITPREQKKIRAGIKIDRNIRKWDSLSSRIVSDFVRYNPSRASLLARKLQERYELMNEEVFEASRSFLGQFTTVRLWNASIVGSILFGMVMMTFVYRYLGQGAEAKQIKSSDNAEQQIVESRGEVLGVSSTADDAESFARQVMEIEQIKSKQALESEIKKMVKGYPMEKMASSIAEQDRTVAAFIVAIGKKESAWGKRVPVLDGKDCYNYWGYRGKRELMGTGGHTCFDSPEDAVATVAKRIEALVEDYGRDTPEEMVVWKCGSNCAVTGGQTAANKWISDVTMYFDELVEEK